VSGPLSLLRLHPSHQTRWHAPVAPVLETFKDGWNPLGSLQPDMA